VADDAATGSLARLRAQVPQLGFEVAEERGGIEPTAGGFRHNPFRGRALPDLMHIAAQPSEQATEIATAYLGLERMIAFVGFGELRGIEAAERVGREIAEHAERPMNILQHAFTI
jgi:hypothetical protein